MRHDQDIMLSQTIYYWQFRLWRQTVRSSSNDTIAFFASNRIIDRVVNLNVTWLFFNMTCRWWLRDPEILSRFAGIPAVLWTLHKLHRAITCKTFHSSKSGSLFCTAGIPLCRDEIFPRNCFSPPPRRDKKVKIYP